MNDCELRPRLGAYLDGELPAADRAAVEAHLRNCPSCAAELKAMRGMHAAFDDLGAALEPSDEQLLQIAQRVRAEPAAAAAALIRLFRRTAAAAIVVLAGSVAAGMYLGHRAKVAAHEALVLDRAAMFQSSSASAGAAGDDGSGEQQVQLAQWIADDLRGRPEER